MNENHLMMYFNNVGDVEGPPPQKKNQPRNEQKTWEKW